MLLAVEVGDSSGVLWLVLCYLCNVSVLAFSVWTGLDTIITASVDLIDFCHPKAMRVTGWDKYFYFEE